MAESTENMLAQHDSLPDLRPFLTKLKIPADYGRVEYVKNNTVPELETWKTNANSVLQEISILLKARASCPLSLESEGDTVFALVPFTSERFLGRNAESIQEAEKSHIQGDWMEEKTSGIAEDILSFPELLQPSRQLITQVLTHNLKPIFKSNPHPHVNVETGRKIGKAVGGPMAMQDYYEGQIWKQYPGIGKVVLWCVRHIDTDLYESVWHLVIPPVMTLLDDYEARYKLQGVFVVQEMLRHVPKDILKRTGIGALLKQSLRTSLSHLQSPETPTLLRHAINTAISLILLTTSISPAQPFSERFDELSSLLGEGVISGIWLYSEDKPEVVKATFDALPALLNALGIGSARFLKALVPQLAHSLIPQPLIKPDRRLQLSAIRVLQTLLDVCKPRIPAWKETMLNGIGQCWVGCVDEESQRVTHTGVSSSNEDIELRDEVKEQLQALCTKLAEVCPSVLQAEYQRFFNADRALFQDLLQPFVDISA